MNRRPPTISAPSCAAITTADRALAQAVDFGQADELKRAVARQVQARRVRRRHAATTAASVAVIALAAWFFRPASGPDPAGVTTPAPGRLVHDRPEISTRALPDGSVVDLNRGAQLEVEFTGQTAPLRRVVLRAGEAHFQVAPDPARPFVVVAGGLRVRAVGTAFNVELTSDTVEVIVTEGRVAIEPASAGADRPTAPLASLTAGQRTRVRYDANPESVPPVLAISPTEQAGLLAWRVPRLDLSSTALAEVLPHFNRHGPSRLELAEPALGQLQISGLLRADDTAALLRVLENEFGLIAETRGAVTVIRRR